MIFNKIFHFVKGYVIIRLTGLYIERFLYICAKRGIKIFNIKNKHGISVEVSVGICDFFKLRSVCKKTGTRVRIIKKIGLPFLIKRIRKRYFLLSGLLVVIILMFLSSQFIWSIEIEGASKETLPQIFYALDKAGLKIGSFKPSLIEGEKMKSIIQNNTDNLVWSWVYIKGTKASVRCREGLKPPEVVDKSVPCDIVAMRDGVISSVLKKSGDERVSVGDVVMKDDLLIAGTLSLGDGTLKTVHALGDVKAITNHEKSRTCKLYYNKAILTGRTKNLYTLKLFSKCFDLFFKNNPEFSDYLTKETLSELKLGKNNYLGIGIYKKAYSEITWVKKELGYDMAVERARNELEEEIAKELLPGSRLIDKKVVHEKINDDEVRVTVIMQFEEKIATKKVINI